MKKTFSLIFIFLLAAQGIQIPVAAAAPLPISAPSALLLDGSTNQVFFAKTPHLRRPPASTTKLLTAIVALKLMDPQGTVIIPKYAESMPASKIYVKAGERYKLQALLEAMLVNSANDAAVAIAIAGSGSIQGFAAEMNKTARSLGCKDSNFVNPNGLPDGRQYSTVYDMALIMREAQRYPLIVNSLKIRTGVIRTLAGRKIYLKNHNKMLWRDSRTILGKTGWTFAAQHCFVGLISASGKKVFVAMLGSHRLWRDLKTLVDFQFGASLIKAKRNERLVARENNKRVQTALKKSGFYSGKITGSLDSKTRRSIKRFQKAHKLKATGSLTARTWQLLKKYL